MVRAHTMVLFDSASVDHERPGEGWRRRHRTVLVVAMRAAGSPVDTNALRVTRPPLALPVPSPVRRPSVAPHHDVARQRLCSAAPWPTPAHVRANLPATSCTSRGRPRGGESLLPRGIPGERQRIRNWNGRQETLHGEHILTKFPRVPHPPPQQRRLCSSRSRERTRARIQAVPTTCEQIGLPGRPSKLTNQIGSPDRPPRSVIHVDSPDRHCAASSRWAFTLHGRERP